jgi:hypothetical protein
MVATKLKGETMKNLTITTTRNIPEEDWDGYKKHMDDMGVTVNWKELEKTGQTEEKKHLKGESVSTIYKLM